MIDKCGRIDARYTWLNTPLQHKVAAGRLQVTTAPDTDFWQNTHYGFQRDSGHFLFARVSGDFSLAVRTEFSPNKQYDQCGLMVRSDSQNWIKTSTEYETAAHSRLGSVVTNLGFSDWATNDVRSIVKTRWYRIQSKGNDFLIEFSADGIEWKQLRITHLLSKFTSLNVGIYACSPMQDGGFEAIFDNYALGKSNWDQPNI